MKAKVVKSSGLRADVFNSRGLRAGSIEERLDYEHTHSMPPVLQEGIHFTSPNYDNKNKPSQHPF